MKKTIIKWAISTFAITALLATNIILCAASGTYSGCGDSHGVFDYTFDVTTIDDNAFTEDFTYFDWQQYEEDYGGRKPSADAIYMVVLPHGKGADFSISYDVFLPRSITYPFVNPMTTVNGVQLYQSEWECELLEPEEGVYEVCGSANIEVSEDADDCDYTVIIGEFSAQIMVRHFPELTIHEEVAANHMSEGHKEYWTCSCGAIYSDPYAIKLLPDTSSLRIPAIGNHVYGETTYEWTDGYSMCTATASCTIPGCTHTLIEEGLVSSQLNSDHDIEVIAVFNTLGGDIKIIYQSGVGAFVQRLYTSALDRPFDYDGREYWMQQLNDGLSGAEVAATFFISDEINSQGLTQREYITRLYITLMDRVPSDEEINYWIGTGLSYEQLFNSFIDTPEWVHICGDYWINSGSPYAKIQDFVVRMYARCLNRSTMPSVTEVNYWADLLHSGSMTGTEVAQFFFFSDEYIAANRTNEEYVLNLYATIMGRTPGPEASYWINALENGASRQDVFNGFITAPEFIAFCNECGIQP